LNVYENSVHTSEFVVLSMADIILSLSAGLGDPTAFIADSDV